MMRGAVLWLLAAVACGKSMTGNGPGSNPAGPQERFSPWTHWFGLSDSASLFYGSHDLESTYAGVTIDQVTTNAGALQFVLEENGFVPQPNEFVSQQIIDELRANGTSATWEALYANAVTGNAIPPPYFGVDQTDPIKAAEGDRGSPKHREPAWHRGERASARAAVASALRVHVLKSNRCTVPT